MTAKETAKKMVSIANQQKRDYFFDKFVSLAGRYVANKIGLMTDEAVQCIELTPYVSKGKVIDVELTISSSDKCTSNIISRYFFDSDSIKVYVHMDESGFVGIYDIDFETHETKSRNHDIRDELVEIANIYFDEVYSL